MAKKKAVRKVPSKPCPMCGTRSHPRTITCPKCRHTFVTRKAPVVSRNGTYTVKEIEAAKVIAEWFSSDPGRKQLVDALA